MRFLQQRWCWEIRWCCRASRRPPAAGEPPPPQRSYRDALLGGPTCHVPTKPLPPAQSGLPAALAACTSVYVRRGGTPPPFALLPYAVLEQGEKIFRLQVGDREEAVSVDRLKPHTGAETVQPATPPKRGRLPGSAASSNTLQIWVT